MIKQKIIKVGNSAAMSIPKTILDNLNVKVGSDIFIAYDPHTKVIMMSPNQQASGLHMSSDMAEWLDDIEKKYSTVIKNLAQR